MLFYIQYIRDSLFTIVAFLCMCFPKLVSKFGQILLQYSEQHRYIELVDKNKLIKAIRISEFLMFVGKLITYIIGT